MSERQPRRWTSAEDQILRERVDAQQAQGIGRDWCQVAMALPGRTNKDCRKRWHNSLAEGLRKGQWSKSEDQLLTRGVHQHGSHWTKVATCVNTRSADQCAKRWQQSLDPLLDRSEWREHEDTVLLAAVERLGRRWKDIQEQFLPHRSKNCVKNRYSVLTRRNATQLMLYEENIESSSSEAGTPLQSEPSLSINYMSMSPMSIDTRTSCQQTYQLHIGDEELSSDWTNLNTTHNALAVGDAASFSHASISAYPAYESSYALYNNMGEWGYMASTMSTQQFAPFSASPPLQFQSYTYPLQQEQQVPTNVSYFPPDISATASRAPIAENSRRPSNRGRHSQQSRDRAAFS